MVRVIEPDAPGKIVAEVQVMPTGRVPQLMAMGLLNPRMLCVLTEIVAVWPAVTVAGVGVAAAVKLGVVAWMVTAAEVAAVQLASPEYCAVMTCVPAAR